MQKEYPDFDGINGFVPAHTEILAVTENECDIPNGKISVTVLVSNLKLWMFRYEYDEYGASGNSQIKITLPSMSSVDSFTINPTRDFFDWMELWFKNKGVELSCNANGSILWSKSGWNK